MENKKIPVTVLTGFLGSGKTTLLNRILSENHGKKIAVIENEFGEIGIDNELVIGADEEIFEMNNGCICCTVRGDLIRILGQLMRRKDRLDHIIVETTGLANPAPVAQTFWVDDEMKEEFSLDAIITIVDAMHVWQHIDDSSECQEQIAFADVILLNKTDLVNDADLIKLEKKIKAMNSQAKIFRTQDAAIDMDKILDVHAFDLEAKAELNPEFMTEEMPFEFAGFYQFNEMEYQLTLQEGPDPSMDILILKVDNLNDFADVKKSAVRLFSEKTEKVHQGKFLKTNSQVSTLVLESEENNFRAKFNKEGIYGIFTQHHPDEFSMKWLQNGKEPELLQSYEFEHSHEHNSEVTSVGLETDKSLEIGAVNMWLGGLLQFKGTDIYRMKGIFNMQGDEDRFVFQGVHMLFDGKPDRPWKPDEKRKSQVVFIGKNLDREALTKGFNDCIAKKEKALSK